MSSLKIPLVVMLNVPPGVGTVWYSHFIFVVIGILCPFPTKVPGGRNELFPQIPPAFLKSFRTLLAQCSFGKQSVKQLGNRQ